jgi:hypothetical protein
MSLSNLIDELKNDCVVDDINLKEAALLLPAKKAKWVSRLILEKNNMSSLEKEKNKLFNEVVNSLKEKSVKGLSQPVLKSLAEKDPKILELEDKMNTSKNLIDFYERIEKVMSSMSFDIGNIIKIVQLETT